MRTATQPDRATSTVRALRRANLAILAALSVLLASTSALAHDDDDDRREGYCSATATLQLVACRNEVQDDYFSAQAICLNVSDRAERRGCRSDTKGERNEAGQLCGEQHEARRDLCDALGEDRYDPDFDPAHFTDDFTTSPYLNTYFPLRIGNRWEYAAPAADETNTVEVLADTKLIEGVTCIVSRDLVSVGGVAKEFTDDWLAQAKNKDVVYCGEEVKDYEIFPGDNPMVPELVSIDGSFKVGRDGDKPGILFPGSPSVGTTYRQEFSVGNAEDVATILSTHYGYGSDPELDEHVPQALADHLCNDDCVVTAESTPIEPDVLQRKYAAPNIGTFLEVDVESGEINQLVGCNVDPKCAGLPTP